MSQDPHKYFRIESRELLDGLIQGALELERGGGGEDWAAGLLRLAHTLKGAARVVKQPAIAELAHAIEGVLAPYRGGGPPPPAAGAELLRLCDGITAQLSALGAAASPATLEPAHAAGHEPGRDAAPGPAQEGLETIRVDIGEVDAVLESLAETNIQLTAIRRQADSAAQARRRARYLSGAAAGAPIEALVVDLDRMERGLGAAVEGAERELTQARERAEQLRLMKVGTMFPALARAAHDAAQVLGKRVECQLAGADVRVEAQVWVRLRQALLHIVGNAVAHGIEPPAARTASGKPEIGRIEFWLERNGAEVVFFCRDDGAGIDLAAVRRAAAARGLLAPAQAERLTQTEAIAMLLRGGLSTAHAVTEVSGRGVGLDVVRTAAAGLKGAVAIDSIPGRGATVQIRVPVSLSSVSVLLVEAGGVVAGIPREAVRQSVLVEEAAVTRTGGRESLPFAGRTIPLIYLPQALGSPDGGRRPRHGPAVVIEAGEERAAVAVDRLQGLATVLVRRLPAEAMAQPIVAGASLDGEGNPYLVLNPAGLAAAAGQAPGASAAPAAVRRAPILVIDDSLTTRMLEQSILEAAGHAVELATCAEEALAMAAQNRYSLFLVDVEMPGMDGFEFVARTRADAQLRDIPAILVTSRQSTEDRRRGEAAGACAYMVKSEFDQNYLLAEIRKRVGGS